jgi:Ca-activated chloride channel homolog
MPLTFYNKTADPDRIGYHGITNVNITLSGRPNIVDNPTDIMLTLDSSGSMAGQPLIDEKEAAVEFVNLLASVTNKPGSETIGGGSRIGVVDFNGSATLTQPLTDSVPALTTAINSLVSVDGTNAGAAFTLAMNTLLASNPGSKKIILIITDGYSSTGIPESQAAKDAGIEIYAVGIGSSIDVDMLNAWASVPIATHVFISPTSSELAEIVEQIAAEIIEAAALNIVLEDVIDYDFKILDALTNKGTIEIKNNKMIWMVSELGALQEETITLNTKLRYVGCFCGYREATRYLSYSDDENHELFFPNPIINVCGPVLKTVRRYND